MGRLRLSAKNKQTAVFYDKKKGKETQSKLHKNSKGREITLDRNEHGRHEGKGSWSLKNLDTQEKPTTPVEGIHKPEDRTGDQRDYLKNSK